MLLPATASRPQRDAVEAELGADDVAWVFDPDRDEWDAAGISSLAEVEAWKALGVHPFYAREWHDAAYTPADAQALVTMAGQPFTYEKVGVAEGALNYARDPRKGPRHVTRNLDHFDGLRNRKNAAQFVEFVWLHGMLRSDPTTDVGEQQAMLRKAMRRPRILWGPKLRRWRRRSAEVMRRGVV